jgi:hypothetical protein
VARRITAVIVGLFGVTALSLGLIRWAGTDLSERRGDSFGRVPISLTGDDTLRTCQILSGSDVVTDILGPFAFTVTEIVPWVNEARDKLLGSAATLSFSNPIDTRPGFPTFPYVAEGETLAEPVKFVPYKGALTDITSVYVYVDLVSGTVVAFQPTASFSPEDKVLLEKDTSKAAPSCL